MTITHDQYMDCIYKAIAERSKLDRAMADIPVESLVNLIMAFSWYRDRVIEK